MKIATTNQVPNSNQRDWTVMVYQGNGVYGKFHTHLMDLKEIEELPQTDRVTFLSQSHVDYKENRIARREIKPTDDWNPCPPLAVVRGRQNQPKTLADFIQWGMAKYPAKHYCLVLSGYAGGFNGMIADKKDDLMSLTNIRKGLEAGLKDAPQCLDVLALDGHWMACAEAVAEFGGTAQRMVASRGRVDSWNYKDSFSGLVGNPGIGPAKVALSLTDSGPADSDMTCLNLNMGLQFVESSKNFCDAVMAEHWRPRAQLDHLLSAHFVDMHEMLQATKDRSVPEIVKTTGEQLEDSLNLLVVKQRREDGSEPTESLNAVGYLDSRVRNQVFHKTTGWGTMMNEMRDFDKRAEEEQRALAG